MKKFNEYKSHQQKGLALDALKGRAPFEGLVTLDYFRNGKVIYHEVGKNIITTQGLDHILDVVFGAVAKNATWYVGIFKNNVTPVACGYFPVSIDCREALQTGAFE